MSTRALYTVRDTDSAWNLYIHGDGYPTGAAAYVDIALKYAWELPRFEADEFAAAMCAAGKEYIPALRKRFPSGGTGGNARFMPQGEPLSVAAENCADIEYRYEIYQEKAAGAVYVKAFDVDIPYDVGLPAERLLFKCKLTAFAATAKAYEEKRAKIEA